MSIDINANAEANVVKATANIDAQANLTINNTRIINGDNPSGAAKFVAGVRRALDPVGYEKKEADATLIRVQSICESASVLRQTFPLLTDEQLFLWSGGYLNMTAAGADNIFKTLEKGMDYIPEGSSFDGMLTEFKDSFILNSASAYDDETRDLFARVLAGEHDSKGSFSKKVLKILSEMDCADATLFKQICSASIDPDAHYGSFKNPAPVLLPDNEMSSTYNNKSVRFSDLKRLETLGLLDSSSLRKYHDITSRVFLIGNETLMIFSEVPKDLVFQDWIFSDYGIQLAALCDIGDAPNFVEFVALDFKNRGWDVFIRDTNAASGKFYPYEFSACDEG